MRPQPLVEQPCVDCRRRIRPRKQVNLGAETVCGSCLATLSPGWTWTVMSGDPDVSSILVCEDCAVCCSKCRPVDARVQWGDDHRQPSYFRKLALAGKLDPANLCQCGCEQVLPTGSRPNRRFIDDAHRQQGKLRRLSLAA
jgi:hypothetical protein